MRRKRLGFKNIDVMLVRQAKLFHLFIDLFTYFKNSIDYAHTSGIYNPIFMFFFSLFVFLFVCFFLVLVPRISYAQIPTHFV